MPAADRVLDFSLQPAYLSVRNEQLVIRGEEDVSHTIPLAEIAVVLLACPRITLTQPVLAGLAAANAAVVVTGDDHLPAAMLLPASVNTLSTQRLRRQIAMSAPRRKRLWQSIVIAKIRAQAAVLEDHGIGSSSVRPLAACVRSGDPDNLEATAAQRYWPLLFGPNFRRRPDIGDCNRLLNYGYAVLRAAIARAICAAGLHPSLGLHHHGRGNPFCLADDLMEPYRPLVDHEVRAIVGEWGGDVGMTPAIKHRLVESVQQRLEHRGEWRQSAEWFQRTAQSLLEDGGRPALFYPESLLRTVVGP